MSLIFYYFFMAVGLSMDAFSLAITYGTTNIRKKYIIMLSMLVGFFHFIMPNIGSLFTNIFVKEMIKYNEIISAIVFGILTMELITSINNEEIKYNISKYSSMLLFALAVSIDSFSVGLVLSFNEKRIILPCLIFSITSFLFTLIGLLLGKILNKKAGAASKVVGIIILLCICIKSIISIFF